MGPFGKEKLGGPDGSSSSRLCKILQNDLWLLIYWCTKEANIVLKFSYKKTDSFERKSKISP